MNNKAKILVLDDDSNLRKTLSDILTLKGYETTVAANGAEAIAAAEGGAYSLALIDLMLPDMPGLEVMARIRELAPLTEVIILTGHASMDTAIEATSHGAFSYLIKPYQMDELLRSIRHAVERQQVQEEIIRLASFPRLHPSPVIEVNASGDVTYANPAAEKLFPEIGSSGWAHPLLREFSEFNLFGQYHEKMDVIREVEIGQATYELHAHYIQGLDLIRIYVLDITQRKRAELKIHLLATTDSLTGIANRHAFSEILTREMDRAKRYATPMSLLMYDIDYFKRVNDSYGHDVGDKVLQAVTAVALENIRSNDVAARWGGEEFMVLMPQSDLPAAITAAEKLRRAIAEHDFEKVGHLTASFGVCKFEVWDDLNSLIKRVDDALYRAKQGGRNRVETSLEKVALNA